MFSKSGEKILSARWLTRRKDRTSGGTSTGRRLAGVLEESKGSSARRPAKEGHSFAQERAKTDLTTARGPKRTCFLLSKQRRKSGQRQSARTGFYGKKRREKTKGFLIASDPSRRRKRTARVNDKNLEGKSGSRGPRRQRREQTEKLRFNGDHQ